MSFLEELDKKVDIEHDNIENIRNSMNDVLSKTITGKENFKFSSKLLIETRKFLKQSNFEYPETDNFQQENMFLNSIAVMASINNRNLKDIFVLSNNGEIDLNYKKIGVDNTETALINLTQKNFMRNQKILGLIPIRHLIIDDKKLKLITKYSRIFEECFDSLHMYQKSEYDMDEIKKNLEKGEKLRIRILGTNHFFLKTEFKAVKNFLDQIPEKSREQITVELLSKSGVNKNFGEDHEPELKIMEHMSAKYLKQYGVKIQSVDSGKHANTERTLVAADKIDSLNGLQNTPILYFMCPNALNRQKYDIELHNLQNSLNTRTNIPVIYYDNCGGYKQLEADLEESVNKNRNLQKAIDEYNKKPTIENLKKIVEKKEKYIYLLDKENKAQKSSTLKKAKLRKKILKELKQLKQYKKKNEGIIEYFKSQGIQKSNILCEAAKQSFVSREIKRRKLKGSSLDRGI